MNTLRSFSFKINEHIKNHARFSIVTENENSGGRVCDKQLKSVY